MCSCVCVCFCECVCVCVCVRVCVCVGVYLNESVGNCCCLLPHKIFVFV